MSRLIRFEPLGKRIEGRPEETLLEAARRAGVVLRSVCGGAGTCRRCRVRVLEGTVSPPAAVEQNTFSAQELSVGQRLACQARVLGDVAVYLPPESLGTAQRLQLEGRELDIAPLPPVVPCPVEVPAPDLRDLRADAERLRDALAAAGSPAAVPDLAVLRDLPAQLRAAGWHSTAYLRVADGPELIGFGRPGEPPLGLAVDLGTTKIAAYLVDLVSGRTLAAAGLVNPQIAYGEDVMARIAYAMEGKEQRGELQRAVLGAVAGLAGQLCAEVGCDSEQVAEAVVVGNTAMHHLFLGLPVAQLGRSPYVPAEQAAVEVKAGALGLPLTSGAYVHMLPNIAGFVGADHVAMLLATGIPQSDEVVLGLDIGTNTEVALRAGGRVIVCSTASGPAFEGAHIRDGMRAAPGAIEGLWVEKDGNLAWQTIGDRPPVGLCGSGVLDAVAALRQMEVLDNKGRMLPHPWVRQGEEGPEFVLVPAARSGHGRDVLLTRRDVEAIQLAKGAIRAGVEIVLQQAGVCAADVERVILAGAFGSYLNVESVLAIGMLPRLSAHRVEQVGNAAGLGARMALLSLEERKRAQQIARQAEYVELTTVPDFSIRFAQAMLLQ